MLLNKLESKDQNDAGLADTRSVLDDYVEQYLNSLHESDDPRLEEWRSNLVKIRGGAKERLSGR
jgi:hypothetical protein